MKKVRFNKPFSKEDIDFVSFRIESYRIPYVLISGLVAIFEIVMIVRALFLFNFAKPTHIAYFCSYCALLIASLMVSASVFFLEKLKHKQIVLYNIEWIYSLVLFLWSFTVSFIDMDHGKSPIVFLTIVIAISGIVLLNPYIYDALLIPSVLAMVLLNRVYHFEYFDSTGDYLNVFVFVVMALIINARIYTVTLTNHLDLKHLERMMMTDSLTGLGNEAKYIKKVQKIEQDIRDGKDIHFMIVMMDVNNLKATNDKYGHRFGCHLIVKTGHILPDIFPHSDLFHIGGDEFIAIIDRDSEYANFNAQIENFENRLDYGTIEYSGVELILSVAHGVGVYEPGMKYSDVLQLADNEMYETKKAMKEKYNFVGR